MKILIASVVASIALITLSCSPMQETVAPVRYSSAKQGSGGGGGSTTPPPSTTTVTPTSLPTLTPNPIPVYDLGPVMPKGVWTVKTYYRSFADNTSDYAGYSFVFVPGGVVHATDNRGVVYDGYWYATIGGQIPYYGGAPSVTAMTMSFSKSAPKQLSRLTATWNVSLATTTTDVIMDNVEPLSGERIELVL